MKPNTKTFETMGALKYKAPAMIYMEESAQFTPDDYRAILQRVTADNVSFGFGLEAIEQTLISRTLPPQSFPNWRRAVNSQAYRDLRNLAAVCHGLSEPRALEMAYEGSARGLYWTMRFRTYPGQRPVAAQARELGFPEAQVIKASQLNESGDLLLLRSLYEVEVKEMRRNCPDFGAFRKLVTHDFGFNYWCRQVREAMKHHFPEEGEDLSWLDTYPLEENYGSFCLFETSDDAAFGEVDSMRE